MSLLSDDETDKLRKGVAVGELRQLFDRANRLEDELEETRACRSDFWREVASRGYPAQAMRQIVAEERALSSRRERMERLKGEKEFLRDVMGDGPLFDNADASSEAAQETVVVDLPGAKRADPEPKSAALEDELERRRAASRESTRKWRAARKKGAKKQAQQ